ncbi:TolB family protein [Muriicola soli]|uniref:Cell envelope biogenesis protein OmpA n=1 Tax=Muriicola soli TaxID=2507538 RepID=A0A411E8U0_9FLAO|nr:PD40 domain-containing protein [Muriicola soli]QBA63953.1 cell envelope biogenesis protein OmpA [Muriicola soli]
MKNSTLCLKIVAAGMVILFCEVGMAQQNRFISKDLARKIEADKRIENYLELSRLGYTEKEIFQDLGNANFLAGNYKAAAFWYQKLIDLSGSENISPNYLKRYKASMQKAGIADFGDEVAQTDWYSEIEGEYLADKKVSPKTYATAPAKKQNKHNFKPLHRAASLDELRELAGLKEQKPDQLKNNSRIPGKGYTPPISISSDGKTAFFSKAVYMKPEYGLFSKKEPIYKIYQAENVNGKWRNVKELSVTPKYASAMHPAVSPDGKRLFFSSDMPGTFGKYDIYVAEIHKDGSVGIAKNLGEKVNTRKNEMYPNLVGGNLLFFASNGREGIGGMDLFAVQVGARKVGMAMNLGAPFNSKSDDYALNVNAETGMAIVMSNRGGLADETKQLVFSISEDKNDLSTQKRKYDFLEVLPMDPNSVYTNIYYQD